MTGEYKCEPKTRMTGTAAVFRSSLCFCAAFSSETAPLFTARLPGLCSSKGAEELQETNRMSVGGRMRGGKSDEEVCVCACVSVCALIPGRTSSEWELLGSSVGVPDVDTGNSRGREKEEKKEGGREREVQGSERDQGQQHYRVPHTHTLTQRETTHRESLR